VANLRASWIGGFKLEVANATSWGQLHSQFRESRYFKAFQLAAGKELGPACSTGRQWFLKTQEGEIILGNSQAPTLAWPTEDTSTTQVWRLVVTLSLDEHHEPGKSLRHCYKPTVSLSGQNLIVPFAVKRLALEFDFRHRRVRDFFAGGVALAVDLGMNL